MDFPVDSYDFVPCGAGGAGEVVHVTGTLHDSVTTTVNGKKVAVQSSRNLQNGVGIGLTTGNTYRATAGSALVLINSFPVASFPAVISIAESFNLIGTTSTAGKLINTFILQLTVNANGATTANIVNQFVQCQ
jgi:hypothetical protein